eukprot:5059005-Prymnesium_polylepis.2
MTQPWQDAQPTPEWLLECLIAMAIVGITIGIAAGVAHRTLSLNDFLQECGVKATRVKRAASEIERKAFHI